MSDRDPLRHDDVTFSHSSRGTYAAGMLVFAAVIGDAALIAEVIDVDAQGRDPRAVPGAPAPPLVSALANDVPVVGRFLPPNPGKALQS